MPPRVSVLLPIRNAHPTLDAALESLREQTRVDFEIVAVDDGSDDGTEGRLDEWARVEPRLRVIHQSPLGLVAALNRGLAAARGDLIARMDADDTCHPERLARQADFLTGHADAGVVACRVAFGGTAAGYARHVDWVNGLLTHDEMALARFRESPLAHPSVMFRRDLTAAHGGYRAGDFPEDYELWLRWFDAGVRFAKLPETLLTWNDPPGRLSRADPRFRVEKFYAIKAGYLARWLAAHNPRHPHVVVVGGGRITRRRVDLLKREGIVVDAWADLDPRKIGQVYDGAPVIHHDAIPRDAFVVPYVGSVGAAEHIRALLESQGRMAGRDFIEAA
jgi:glycosyltransferase involved in cell wall biosynthesis